MNFLIFDNELSSLNLINKLLSDFYHIKLITTNQTITISKSQFLSIDHSDIYNASKVIENISLHKNDPFDSILIFNLSLITGISNIIKSLERIKRNPPRIFLIFTNQQNEIDQNIKKLFQESVKPLQWTIIICNQINSSISTKYQIETKPNSTNQQSVNADDFLDFLRQELKMKNYLNEIIYFYQS